MIARRPTRALTPPSAQAHLKGRKGLDAWIWSEACPRSWKGDPKLTVAKGRKLAVSRPIRPLPLDPQQSPRPVADMGGAESEHLKTPFSLLRRGSSGLRAGAPNRARTSGRRSLDYLIGAQQQRLRNRETERLRSLEVDNQPELRWPFDREFASTSPLENLVICAAERLPRSSRSAPYARRKPASAMTELADRQHPICCRERCEPRPVAHDDVGCNRDERLGTPLPCDRKGLVDSVLPGHFNELKFQL